MSDLDAKLTAYENDLRAGQKEVINMVDGDGKYSGACKFFKYGDLDSGQVTDVWESGGTYHYMGTAEHLRCSSDDNTDAGTITVFGHGSGFVEQSENVIIDGTNWVETGSLYMRTYRGKNISDGGDQGTGFTGDITCVAGTGSHIQATISATESQTLMCQRSVCAGKTMYITAWTIGADKSGGGLGAVVGMDLKVREPGGVFQTKEHLGLDSKTQNLATQRFFTFLRVPEKSDIKIVASGTGGDNNVVFGSYDFWLKEND